MVNEMCKKCVKPLKLFYGMISLYCKYVEVNTFEGILDCGR